MAALPHNLTFDCADPYELGQFWSTVFDRPLHDDDHPGDPAALIEMAEGPGVLSIGVPEGKPVKNRLHLDLAPTDRTRDEESSGCSASARRSTRTTGARTAPDGSHCSTPRATSSPSSGLRTSAGAEVSRLLQVAC